MHVAILYQSLRGGTKKASHKLAEEFLFRGATVGTYPVTNFDAQFVLKANLLVVGTWTDGFFGLGARPGQLSKLNSLPPIAHKATAVFVTYEINGGRSLLKLVDWVERQDARVVASQAFNRRDLSSEIPNFVDHALNALVHS